MAATTGGAGGTQPVRPTTYGARRATHHRSLLDRVLRPALDPPPRSDPPAHDQVRRHLHGVVRWRGPESQAPELDDPADANRGTRGRDRRAQARRRGPAGHPPRRRPLRRRARLRAARGSRAAREGRRRGPPAAAARRRSAVVRRGVPTRPARVAERHRAGRPLVPRRGGRVGRGRDQANRHDRGGRAALALPRAHPRGARHEQLPRRARRPGAQAASAYAGSRAGDRVRRGGPRGPSRRPRARLDAFRRLDPYGPARPARDAAAPAPLASRAMPDEDTQAVLTERRDGVLLITLNRPDARNAVNFALAEGVATALDDLDESDDV